MAIDITLFGRLKRLFSTDVIIRNVGGNQLRTIDVDRLQTYGNIQTNSLIDRFSRIHSGSSKLSFTPLMNYHTLRTTMYTDYEAMDTDAIVASALDIIADEATLKNEQGEILHIKSSNDNLQKVLYNLFYEVLNIEFNLWAWTRAMCKYGDFYLHLSIAEKFGVYNVTPFSVYDVQREEGTDPNNPSYVRFKININQSHGYASNLDNGSIIDNYEMAHFRLLSDTGYLPYGRSYLEPGRKIFKQLNLMEDAMLIHRIMRAPEKRIFYVNVGNIAANEVDGYMERLKQNVKKVPYVDQQTGDYNLKYNMMNLTEDFYLPVRGNDTTTKIDTLKGMEYTAIEDVSYLRDKLFAALRVPKAFLGYEKDLCISLDTKIPLLDGRILTAGEIINEYKAGNKNYVYSLDETTQNIVPGEIEWAGLTRMDTKTVKVWLDNNEFIQCTPDHLFMTRKGEWKEAQNLQEDESLMPLYLQKSTDKKINGYTEVYNPRTGKYEFVHRLVADYYGIKEKGKVIHHIDCNKLNNNPENLDGKMNFWEHRQWHIENSKLCHTPEANNKRINTHRNLMLNGNYAESKRSTAFKNSKKLVKWIQENGASRKGFVKNKEGVCIGCGNVFDKTVLTSRQRNNIYCSNDCKKINWKSKYKNITLDQLINNAISCKNFTELKNKLNIKDHSTLNRIFNNLSLSKEDFIIHHMPSSHNNPHFMNQFELTNVLYNESQNKKYKNHKVSKIEWIEESINTCDLTISKYHNFGTNAGVIIHNSGKATLASEDIRFARTVERIQRILISELTKIALVHLYTQGFNDEELTNFELSLTTPSIIYEQEKIALWKEKVDLSGQMMEKALFPSDWIYQNVWHLSEEQFSEIRNQVIEDKKRVFRNTQIENEGNDPIESGQSYGTPHDLATLYGAGRNGIGSDNVPLGYDEKEQGRPAEKVSNYGTQQHQLGRDPIGRQGMNEPLVPKLGHGANWSLESKNIEFLKNKNMLTELKKKLNIFKEPSILDETNIKDI